MDIGGYSCKCLPPYRELSYSSLATLMLDGFLRFMNHTEVTLVFLHYGLTFSEQDLNTSLFRRPAKVSGVSRVSHLYFFVWRIVLVARIDENFLKIIVDINALSLVTQVLVKARCLKFASILYLNQQIEKCSASQKSAANDLCIDGGLDGVKSKQGFDDLAVDGDIEDYLGSKHFWTVLPLSARMDLCLIKYSWVNA